MKTRIGWLFCCLLGVQLLAAQAADSTVLDSVAPASSKYFAVLQDAPDTTSETLMQEAIAHFDGQRYQRSIDLLDAAIRINEHEPLTPILYYYRGVAKVKQGDAHGAVQDYDAALQAAPHKTKYRYQRGLAYFQLGDYARARRDFEKTMMLEGSNADLRVKLGFLKQQEQDISGAIDDYTAAIAHNPQFAEPHYYRGMIYLRLLLKDKACEDLQRAADLGHAKAALHLQNYCNDH